ncbi:IS110 family transposase [Aggregatilinea lenta]|uniref:IS110 family transposase n=1 Tax=Aggregatilinea lenta TaxID=913108 RepID=UPI000E5B16F5|nr:IS110 family transposase [Aggregatilinea lenta]
MEQAAAVVGIDVSKATLDVAVVQGGKKAEVRQYANDAAGVKALATWLKQRRAREAHVCLEATGTYGDAVALALYQAGYRVSVVNPARIKAYGQSQLKRNKTDRLDAALIADFCRTQQPELWTPPDPVWLELRAMARHLVDLKSMRQQEKNRLGVETSTKVQEVLEAHITFIDHQIEDLEQDIQRFIDQHPDLKRDRELLVSIPGLSDLSASLLLAEVPDLRAFGSARQLVAFAGLNPQQRTSGSSVRGQTPLSKMGSPTLRRVLYMPALAAQRFNPILAPWAAQLKARGKSKMETLGAVMRKLLVLAYGVLKSGQPFDPAFSTAAP